MRSLTGTGTSNCFNHGKYKFPPQPATRIRPMGEAVEFIRKMWTAPRTTFHGRYFHTDFPSPERSIHP